jgi:hypothetical protein
MSYSQIDINTFTNKFKHPILTTNIKIKSDTASKSYNDLYHTFTLPIIGDYAHNFMITSNHILKCAGSSIITVDSLNNYIDSFTLCINNRTNILSCVDDVPKIETLNSYSINVQPIIRLDFLNLPLLTKCAVDANFMICIKFKQIPPINYTLSYDVMFVDDNNYGDLLSKEYFSIRYISQQSRHNCKPIDVIYDRGKITF